MVARRIEYLLQGCSGGLLSAKRTRQGQHHETPKFHGGDSED